jgi:hypothetical protein
VDLYLARKNLRAGTGDPADGRLEKTTGTTLGSFVDLASGNGASRWAQRGGRRIWGVNDTTEIYRLV